MKYKPAPIVCFAYSRPDHLEKMLFSLQNNNLAEYSDLTFFINGADESTNTSNWEAVIDVAKKDWTFKSIQVNIRETNIGPKNNIINGISEMFSSHEKVIIVEDDLILGPFFLEFLNDALNKYYLDKNIMHINGWAHPQLIAKKNSTAISRYMSPWGWATWADRWKFMTKDDNHILNKISHLSEKEKYEFNMYGKVDWEGMIKRDQEKIDNTWDCYWYQAIYLNNGKTLFPFKTHVVNNGFDGTGEHCGDRNQNYPFDKDYNLNRTKNFAMDSSKKSLIYDLNLRFFNNMFLISDYISFHKEKFKSLDNFKKFLKKKFLND